MKVTRRNLLKWAGAGSAAVLTNASPLWAADAVKPAAGAPVAPTAPGAPATPPTPAVVWNKAAFEAKGLEAVVAALGGGQATESREVQFVKVPDIAADGSAVPLSAMSRLPRTESISFLVEKNPQSLVAHFAFGEGAEAIATAKAKMGQTGDVIALVKADGKFFYAKKEIKVTIADCG